MVPLFFHSESGETRFVLLNKALCEACWDCVEKCHRQVIDKIDFWFHRHARIVAPDLCTGCLKCVKACASGALTAKTQAIRMLTEH